MTDDQAGTAAAKVQSVSPHRDSGKAGAVAGGRGSAASFAVNSSGIEAPVRRTGVDRRAVLAFDRAGVEHWAKARGRTDGSFPAGALGEHLVIENLVADLCIGDELAIGSARFRVTAPLSYGELGERMGQIQNLPVRIDRKAFDAAFQNPECPAVWLQVLAEGELRVGEAVTKVPGQGERVPVTEAFRGWGWDLDLKQRLSGGGADAPVPQHVLNGWRKGSEHAVSHALGATQRLGIVTAQNGTGARHTA